MKNINVLTVILLLFALGLGYFLGTKYPIGQKTSGTTFNKFRGQNDDTRNRQTGTNNQGRIGNGNRPLTGEIIGSDDKSITVKLTDGSSKIVFFSENVSINKTDPGSKSDLVKGIKVGIFGSENTNGSYTAQSIQLNPLFNAGGNRQENHPPQ